MHRLILLAALSATLMACSSGDGDGDAEARREELAVALSKSLRPGASKEAVTAFFADQGLVPFFSDKDRLVMARESNVESKGMVTTDIVFFCELDVSARLESCRSEFQLTGP